MNITVLNPTEQIRTNVAVLARQIPEKEGVSLTVLAPERASDWSPPSDEITVRYYNSMQIPEIRYPIPCKSFFSLLREQFQRTDILIAIDYDYIPTAIAAIAASPTTTSVVVTTDALPGVSWSYGHPVVDAIASVYTHTLGRITFFNSDRILGLGEYLRPGLERFSSSSKINIIPNGIDVDKYRSSESQFPGKDSALNLVYVGRLDPVKGVANLLEAVAKLQSEGLDVTLTLVGDGTKRKEYEQMASTLDISESITFVGYQKEIVPYYSRADICVLPSLSEGQPTVLMEAQANGTPVVTTDVGGARELVAAGCVVRPDDHSALAEGISELAQRDLTELGETAREYAIDNFSETTMVERYLELCRDLC